MNGLSDRITHWSTGDQTIGQIRNKPDKETANYKISTQFCKLVKPPKDSSAIMNELLRSKLVRHKRNVIVYEIFH